MSFRANNTVEMMVLNSFAPRFNPRSIPSYDDWVASSTFDPFGPKPFTPTSYANRGIPLHPQTRRRFRLEEGVDVDNRFNCGYGSSEVDTTRNFPQARPQFEFAQERVGYSTNVVSQVSTAQVYPSPAGRTRSPAPIKATSATVPRVVGPRPFRSQHAFHTSREPLLVVPKAVHPLPTWLTHFEDYEEELLAEFCPPPNDSSHSISTLPMMARAQLRPDRVPQYLSPFNTAPLSRFVDSSLDYTGTDIEAGDWRSEGGEYSDEEDDDYDPFESDVDSESSAPASHYRVDAGDWPTPSRGYIVDGEEYPHTSAVIPRAFPPQGSYSLPASGPRAPSFDPFDRGMTQSPGFIPWSAFTNPFTGAPITETPPPQSSVASVSSYNTADGLVTEAEVDRFLVEVEEGLGPGSGSGFGSESSLDLDGWYDWFDPAGYTSPVIPHHLAPGFEAPPPMHTTMILSPGVEGGDDVGLDAVVIIPRSPVPWWRRGWTTK